MTLTIDSICNLIHKHTHFMALIATLIQRERDEDYLTKECGLRDNLLAKSISCRVDSVYL